DGRQRRIVEIRRGSREGRIAWWYCNAAVLIGPDEEPVHLHFKRIGVVDLPVADVAGVAGAQRPDVEILYKEIREFYIAYGFVRPDEAIACGEARCIGVIHVHRVCL